MIRIRTAALALVLTVGAGGVAAAQTTPDRPNRERAEMGRHRGRGGNGMGGLMKGVNLTNAQKTQAKQIRDKYKPQFESLRESMRPAGKEMREARQRGDSAAAKAAWDRTADTRAKMTTLREQQMSELRAILTPAQRTTFDANLAQMKSKREEWGGKRKAHQS